MLLRLLVSSIQNLKLIIGFKLAINKLIGLQTNQAKVFLRKKEG